MRFEGEQSLGTAIAPVGPGNGKIRIDNFAIEFAVLTIIAAQSAQTANCLRGQLMNATGTCVAKNRHLHSVECAVGHYPCLIGDRFGVASAAAMEFLGAG